MKGIFLKRLWSFIFLFLSPTLLAQSLNDLESVPDSVSRIKQLKIKNLSDLQQLTPYESVSVIQKRYLPKTFRGEFNLSVSSVINHTYFYLGGLSAKTGFFFREDHGLGLEGFALLPSINKRVTNDMIGPPNHILPYTEVFSQLYGGLYYKWSPVFGKFSVLNKKIIYFDMYLTFGSGVSRVVSGLDEEDQKLFKETVTIPQLVRNWFPSASLSVGQIFAFSQDWAFNWELKWFYTYAIVQYRNKKSPYTPVDMNLSLGINYYFPEAGYR